MSQTKAQLIDTLVASLLPASDSAVDIGSNAVRFANIYGDTLYGSGANLTGLNIVTDTSPQLGGNLDVNTKNILFGDSVNTNDDRLKFGAGEDLQIYHDGTISRVQDDTNHLYVKGVNITLFKGNSAEKFIDCITDGAVELYYDNSKKFETTNTGITLNGTAHLVNSGNFYPNSDGAIQLGLSNRKWSTINGVSLNINGGDAEFRGTTPGTTDMTWDQSENALNFDDNVYAHFGNGDDLKIYHNGTNSIIENSTGNLQVIEAGQFRGRANGYVFNSYNDQEGIIKGFADGAVELYYDASKKFETTSDGISVTGSITGTGHLDLGDDARLKMGTSDDLEIFHSGGNSFISNSTGYLLVNTEAGDSVIRASNNVFLQPASGESGVIAKANGAVELYYDNSKRFETLAGGVQWTGSIKNPTDGTDQGIYFGVDSDFQISHDGSSNHIKGTGNHFTRFWTGNTNRWNITNDGHFRPEANNAYDIGASNQRVRNIYTNDLNLSNEGSANDVDGTWGSYTIQEGEESLFLINKRNGKKYKFNLTEVS